MTWTTDEAASGDPLTLRSLRVTTTVEDLYADGLEDIPTR